MSSLNMSFLSKYFIYIFTNMKIEIEKQKERTMKSLAFSKK